MQSCVSKISYRFYSTVSKNYPTSRASKIPIKVLSGPPLTHEEQTLLLWSALESKSKFVPLSTLYAPTLRRQQSLSVPMFQGWRSYRVSFSVNDGTLSLSSLDDPNTSGATLHSSSSIDRHHIWLYLSTTSFLSKRLSIRPPNPLLTQAISTFPWLSFLAFVGMSTTIFAYATCSLCTLPMYDEAQPAAERHCWLGRCSHRLCLLCFSRLASPASTCPVCRNSSLFKRVYFSNASHVVELLCSTLSELTSRAAFASVSVSPPAPVLPSPSHDLFSIPLESSSTLRVQSHYPRHVPVTAASGPQQREDAFDLSFSSFSSSKPGSGRSFEQSAPSPPRKGSKRAAVEELEEMPVRKVRLQTLDEHQALAVANDSRLTSKIQRNEVTSYSRASSSTTRPTTTQSKKTQRVQPHASSSSSLAYTVPNTTTATIKKDPPKRSSRDFIANLVAQFEQE